MDPSNRERLLARGKYTGYRNYYTTDKTESNSEYGQMFSKWVDLTAGEYYYIETTLINVVGNAHLTVGMEIDTDEMPP